MRHCQKQQIILSLGENRNNICTLCIATKIIRLSKSHQFAEKNKFIYRNFGGGSYSPTDTEQHTHYSWSTARTST